MNSHQKVPASQPSANSQPSSTARRHGRPVGGRAQMLALHDTWRSARCANCHTSAARLSHCSHQCGCPVHGSPIDSACTTPATSAMGGEAST